MPKINEKKQANIVPNTINICMYTPKVSAMITGTNSLTYVGTIELKSPMHMP
jgi:hypothetical protein